MKYVIDVLGKGFVMDAARFTPKINEAKIYSSAHSAGVDVDVHRLWEKGRVFIDPVRVETRFAVIRSGSPGIEHKRPRTT